VKVADVTSALDASGPAGGLPSRAAVTALQQHPQFHAAVMASARGSIGLYRGGRLWNWVLSDRARALLGHAVLYLDATARPDDPRSGLTATRLKALCVETGSAAPGAPARCSA
jgi:hypothetical protein